MPTKIIAYTNEPITTVRDCKLEELRLPNSGQCDEPMSGGSGVNSCPANCLGTGGRMIKSATNIAPCKAMSTGIRTASFLIDSFEGMEMSVDSQTGQASQGELC